jgi:hypothetical protein
LGHIEDEVKGYREEIQRRRYEEASLGGYLPAEEQFRRAWETPRPVESQPSSGKSHLVDEKQIKRLYRQLARRYHPDLADNQADRDYRTGRMAALNEAYAARSMIELLALGNESESQSGGQDRRGEAEREMIEVVTKELNRIKRRLRQIEIQKENLHNHPAVELSLEVKLANLNGRDLLTEMATEIKRKIAIKLVERDFLKAQLDLLPPTTG